MILGAPSSIELYFMFVTGFHTELEVQCLAILPSQQTLAVHLFLLTLLVGVTATDDNASFCKGAMNPNYDFHACLADTLPSESCFLTPYTPYPFIVMLLSVVFASLNYYS